MSRFGRYSFFQLPDLMEEIRKHLRIAVVYGGDSSEENAVINKTRNYRSWKSYKTVAYDIQNALRENGFQWVTIFPDDMSLIDNLKKEQIQFVWLNTGGVQGINPMSHTAGILEMLGIPYVGHNPINATLLDNKHIFKHLLHSYGIPTAPFVTWDGSKGDFLPSANEEFQNTFAKYDGPFIVKPVSGRASLHVHYVEKLSDLTVKVKEVYNQTHNLVMIEKYLSGREFCASVYGHVQYKEGQFFKHPDPQVFSVSERVFEPGEMIFTSMDQKQISEKRVTLLNGKKEEKLLSDIVQITQKVYEAFHLSSLIRLDIRADENGNLNILEVNPKPDLKRPADNITSIVCLGLKEMGINYKDLITGILADRIDKLLSNEEVNLFQFHHYKGVSA
ncbi:D-alanine--D-alanine ligase [Collibacillus ludicampi]|uniref:D-alanine--D-alanine ligase n=1 Tax=Collibacillus ludicampi TaxID=2771369 RepID=A0AAV4LN96_9BACL|nr:hypothetical protein [Collibacillus ludicampi]GIM48477.1 D-alanine--D-alanine ligase [Collibacillus ludicampi]